MSSRGASDRPVTYQGMHDPDLTYHPRMVVQHEGGTYMAVARNTAVLPDPGVRTPWLPLGGGGGGLVLWVGPEAPTGAYPFWFDTDEVC